MKAAQETVPGLAGGHRLIWGGAAAIAVGAHLAIAAFAFWHAEPSAVDDQPSGDIVMELSPILASPASNAPSTTVGPESADSVASQPQTVAKPPDPTETEVPIAPPSPTVPEPDLAVAKPVPETKTVTEPTPEAPKPEATREASADLSVASQAAAPPKIEAPPAPKSSAPEIGVSPRAAKARATWHQSIVAHLNRFKHFPANAPESTRGEVIVQFTVDREGRMTAPSVVRSSGSGILDQESLALLKRASPLPVPSKDIAGETFTLNVPVVFRRR